MDMGDVSVDSTVDMRSFKDTVNERIGDGLQQLFTDGELSDVTVTVGSDVFPCHRSILASVSEFFRALFRNEASLYNVTLDSDHVSPGSFAVLVDMLYKKSDGVVDSDIAKDLLFSASFLQIPFLQEHCEKYLVRTMKPDTCPDLWQFAELYTLEMLEGGAKKMATSRILEVSKSKAFNRLPLRFLLALLSSEDLVVTKEDHVAEGIIKWVTADKGEREKYLPVLLPFVTFINVSDRGIHSLRKPCSYINYIQVYLDEALTYKLERATNINSLLRQEILARQVRRVSTNEVDTVMAAYGCLKQIHTYIPAFIPLTTGSESKDIAFASIPNYFDQGAGFATCMFSNELYITGQDELCVYNSGAAEWRALLDLDQYRQGHAMVAVGRNIYLLGGAKSIREFYIKYDAVTDVGKLANELDEDVSAEREVATLHETISAERELVMEVDESLPAEIEEKSTHPSESFISPAETQVSDEELCHGAIAIENEKTNVLCEISVYCTETQTWKTFPRLLEPVTDVTAVVLGHRIYVIGGNHTDGYHTPLVQCVNTLTAMVYRAGNLPFPTSGARAVSDGSAIYVVVTEGDVYQMQENIVLMDQREKQLESGQTGDGNTLQIEKNTNRPEQLTATTDYNQERMAATFRETKIYRETNSCSDQTALQQSLDGESSLTQHDGEMKKEEAGDKRQDSSDENNATDDPLTTKEESPSSVSFKKLAVIPGRRHFGACLYKGELWVAGGQDAEGASISDVIGVDLHTGTVTTKPQTLEMSRCDLHVINVPKLSDNVDFRFTFRPEDIPNEKDRACSSDVKIGTEIWRIEAERRKGFLSVFMCRRRRDFARKWMVSAKWDLWFVPVGYTQQKNSLRNYTYTFKDSERGSGRGSSKFIKMETLTDPGNGYINADGEVTMQASFTITMPCKLEPLEPETK